MVAGIVILALLMFAVFLRLTSRSRTERRMASELAQRDERIARLEAELPTGAAPPVHEPQPAHAWPRIGRRG